jgi:tryptophan synthase alpha chain
MKTYKQVFSELKEQNRTALIPFFVIGDPDFDTSLEIVKSAINAGADVLELGIAFSDPIADGPTIQKADIRAMRSGMSVAKALEFVKTVKDYKDIPIGLLMYYNLIYQYGTQKFLSDFHKAGVNSVLVADLSINDADEIAGPATSAGLDTVFMVTPVTSPELTSVPVCVGFGISKPEQAAAVARAGADGVIIGSKLVGLIEKNLSDSKGMLTEISTFLTKVKSAI